MTGTAHLDTGLQLARDKQYNEAIEEFNLFLSQDHTYADAFYYRGCAYLHLSKYEKAINDFTSAISSLKLSIKHELPALYKRGYAHFKINQLDSALDDYRHYLYQCESVTGQGHLIHKGLFQIGVIHTALNEYDSAISYFTDAIEASTNTEEDNQKLYYLHRGRAYASCAKYDEAKGDFQLVLNQTTDPFIKGCAYNELGQHQDALREFDSLLQPNGNESKLVRTSKDHILFRRGLSHGSLNLYDHALSDFQRALNNSEHQGSSDITDRILFRKGMANMALNDPHKALIDFNESTKLNENQFDVFYARGMLHYTLGRHAAAVHDQRKALKLDKKSSSAASVFKTIFYANRYNDDRHIYVHYENKIHEAKDLLEKKKGTLMEADIHRMIAEYLQKQASSSNNPLVSYKSAREHIFNALNLSKKSPDADITSLAVNSYCKALCLAEKYSNGNIPKSVITECIKCAAESILDMSNLFDKCVITQDWHNLSTTLYKEINKSNIQQASNFDKTRNAYMKNQIEKLEIMQKTMVKFDGSSVQQEFYGFLIIRLCNLFDGIRIASTGIFSHSLKGTLTKVSWIFKLLGELFEYAPICSQYGKKVFGICGRGLEMLDEIRIENALNHMGKLGNQTMFNETADAIATELTIMYENQIKRFPTKSEETATANSEQQEPDKCCKCANCCKKCSDCCGQQKNRFLNEAERSTMQTIVEYGMSMILGYITRFEVKDIKKIKDVETTFVNEVCRPPLMTVFYTLSLADKIKPLNATKDDDHWNTYDFFRRPAIKFKNGIIRARDQTDVAKFDCRKPTIEEEQLLKTKPEELDKYGLKITINTEN